jgi:hypothetical protein
MKTPNAKVAITPQSPAFQKTLHRLRPDAKATDPSSKPIKRDNKFSQSRDTREDRGSRQMKTAQNSQTFPYIGSH